MLAIAAAIGCGAPSSGTRSLEARTLPGCALDDVVRIELQALDDGPARAASFVSVDPHAPTDLLGAPAAARVWVIEGTARDGRRVAFGLLESGAAETPATGAIFREGAVCDVESTDGSAARMQAFTHYALAKGLGGVLLAGGRDDAGHARADAVWIDARMAMATRVAAGLLRRRDDAAVVKLGAGVIVAGGRDDAQTWSDAEWIDPAVRPLAFVRTPIALSEARAESAAIELSSGDALLVGGRGANPALDTLETIDPHTRTARSVDLARLSHARRAPHAVRLATGEIAVFGGFDAQGAPVPDVELFSADATRVLDLIPFAAATQIDGIALASGALLLATVVDTDGSLALSLVRADGGVESLRAQGWNGMTPRWIGATDGAPFLWDGAFRRFSPWGATLVDAALPTALVPDIDPPFALADGIVAVARRRSVDVASLGFGAARYDVRNALTSDPDVLGLGSTQHLVPDRYVGLSATRDGLTLPAGTRVAVTDTSYVAFVLRIGATGRDLPAIELRTEVGQLVARVGDATCPFPAPTASSGEASFVRDAAGGLSLHVDGATRTCTPLLAGPLRVGVSVVASVAGARVRGLTLTRTSADRP